MMESFQVGRELVDVPVAFVQILCKHLLNDAPEFGWFVVDEFVDHWYRLIQYCHKGIGMRRASEWF